mgnify:CR=1 FL=1
MKYDASLSELLEPVLTDNADQADMTVIIEQFYRTGCMNLQVDEGGTPSARTGCNTIMTSTNRY